MLKKELGAVDVFSIAAGAMISSGLFVLPGIAFAKAGPSMILAYAFAGILMIPALMAKAELVTAMPKAGRAFDVRHGGRQSFNLSLSMNAAVRPLICQI